MLLVRTVLSGVAAAICTGVDAGTRTWITCPGACPGGTTACTVTPVFGWRTMKDIPGAKPSGMGTASVSSELPAACMEEGLL